MILVTGATGHLGTAVVQRLIDACGIGGFAVLARDSSKAQPLIAQGIEVRTGDFDRPETLVKAFRGIHKLLLISTMAENRLEQHRAVVDAARHAGVAHVVYTGLAIQSIATSHVRALMESHFQTEDYIRQSGLAYTFLRNTMYAEAIPMIVGAGLIGPRILLPSGAGKVPYVLRRELGEAAANVLCQSGHENTTYHLVGTTAYDYHDIALLLRQGHGLDVDYVDVPQERLQDLMACDGRSAFEIQLTVGTVLDIRARQYELEGQALDMLLGRATANLDAMMAEVLPPDWIGLAAQRRIP